MTQILFDPAAFVQQFPEFVNVPAGTLQMYWDTAVEYISDQDYGCYMLTGGARVLALNQLTAHIAKLFALIAAGETPAPMQRARIDKVEIEVVPPPTKSLFGYWLSSTSYGLQLNALLASKTAGGLYVGVGLPERAAFRKAGGIF